jgi:hypothetical protein
MQFERVHLQNNWERSGTSLGAETAWTPAGPTTPTNRHGQVNFVEFGLLVEQHEAIESISEQLDAWDTKVDTLEVSIAQRQ